ncbi:MAG: glutamate--tRNA ligase family protein [Chthoniobacteraceae bacterium]|nr:glutamate--tRNA ligase family protein [Chthoniobacteraceae bacterium]
MSSNVRVRFAPSPTGYLHVGGARTALFNWLYARHTGGSFILRIEDTDKARNTAEATQAIYDGLNWLGLDWDEGPFKGGNHGPYFQSEREDIYLRYFNRLKGAGHLYEEANGAWRFRSQRKVVVLDDLVCGHIEFDLTNPETHPDITIRRPDGGWIFHFVNVVDDIEMKMTHVIRGEDHLSNTPKHLELYAALGAQPPRFAHIPLILNRDGSKMSKRDQGASIAGYIEQGYAPEAVRNYLCLLGWSPKENREIIPIEEITAKFDVPHLNRKNASFDLEKCHWMNVQYLVQMSLERFMQLSLPFIQKAGISYGTEDALRPVLAIVKEKTKQLDEVPDRIGFFFTEAYSFEEEAVEKTLRAPGALEKLLVLAGRYEASPEWTPEALEATLKATAAEQSWKNKELIHPARIAVSGRSVGPSLYHMMEVLGKERTVARMRATAARFAV